MKTLVSSLILGSAWFAASTAFAQSSSEVDAMKQQLANVMKSRQMETAHLANFDDLDFNVYSGQKWDELQKSHSKDITVHYADGHVSKGISSHIDELKAQFVFAPDSRVTEHPIRIASGDWTAVMGTFEGTFSQPMPIGDGKSIPATGKTFKMSMTTIGHWKDGVMDEEWLFWDNLAFMKQVGIAP